MEDIDNRIYSAIDRITSGQGCMRVPADLTDPDLVLADCLSEIIFLRNNQLAWRTIESAPLREAVLIYHKAHWTRCAAKHEDGGWVKWPSSDYGDSDYRLNYQPTHWCPLPDTTSVLA